MSIFIENNRADEAFAIAKAVQKQRVGSPIGLALEGDALAVTGKWDQAVVIYRKALDLGKAPDLAIKLHGAQIRVGRKSDADKTAAEWLREQPKDLAMRRYLAERAIAEQRYEDAYVLYRKLDELAPDNALVLNNRAWVAGQLKNPEAIALAERAVALAPNAPAILDTLGMLQLEAGQDQKGLENVRKAVGLSPDAPALRLNLVRAYVKLAQKDEARKELEILLKQVPEGSALQAEAKKLKQAL
jgi:putative PEP-CTERM system TPR-repeat lipoprotein